MNGLLYKEDVIAEIVSWIEVCVDNGHNQTASDLQLIKNDILKMSCVPDLINKNKVKEILPKFKFNGLNAYLEALSNIEKMEEI